MPALKQQQQQPDMKKLNPKSTHFEFMGPHLTPLVVFGITIVPYLLYFTCNEQEGCSPVPAWMLSADTFYPNLVRVLTTTNLISSNAILAILAWMAFHFSMYFVLPGPIIEGTLIRDGTRLKYPINGFSSFVVTMALIFLDVTLNGPGTLLWIADHFIQLSAATTLLCIGMSTYLYLNSFRRGALLALGGNTGYPVYDFFIGRELNPRIGFLDLKYFCELRPGLIGWVVLNMSFVAKQAVESGNGLAGVSASLWLVFVFQTYYVIDALWNEPAILTTMDITTDGFGYMLNFGDLGWVPFTYSVQARYLSFNPVQLSPLTVVGLLGLKCLGLYIFRSSNGEKNEFRTNPNSPHCKKMKYMETSAGSKLLTSGWWGTARHINYTGDWIMALSWCLPTGFNTPITYFYAIYFAILLWHRELRDEHKCKAKYGKDWDKYCKIVPYRFIPYIY